MGFQAKAQKRSALAMLAVAVLAGCSSGRPLDDPVLQEASALLDPEQLELFESYYAQFVAFHEQRLRMAQQFFNSDP